MIKKFTIKHKVKIGKKEYWMAVGSGVINTEDPRNPTGSGEVVIYALGATYRIFDIVPFGYHKSSSPSEPLDETTLERDNK